MPFSFFEVIGNRQNVSLGFVTLTIDTYKLFRYMVRDAYDI